MKKLLSIAIIAIVLAVIAAPLEAQNKRAERKAKQMEAYNKALKAIESGYFVLIPDYALEKKTSFVLIKGDKGAIQYVDPRTTTGLQAVSDKKIEVRPNGDVTFRCIFKPYNRAGEIIYITLKHGGDVAHADVRTISGHDFTGTIYPESEADYILFKNLRDSSDTQ